MNYSIDKCHDPCRDISANRTRGGAGRGKSATNQKESVGSQSDPAPGAMDRNYVPTGGVQERRAFQRTFLRK